jgi:hypothetical protein
MISRNGKLNSQRMCSFGLFAWLKAHSTEIKDLWVPLITASISLLSVSIAFLTLVFGRKDRRERPSIALGSDRLRLTRGKIESDFAVYDKLSRKPELEDRIERLRILVSVLDERAYKAPRPSGKRCEPQAPRCGICA